MCSGTLHPDLKQSEKRKNHNRKGHGDQVKHRQNIEDIDALEEVISSTSNFLAKKARSRQRFTHFDFRLRDFGRD